MNEQKLYAVKNYEGEWLSFDSSHESVWYTNNPTFFNDKSYAEAQAGPYGHVVELVEAPEKVVVNAEEAKMLKKAKNTTVWRPAAVIQKYAYEHEQQADDEVLLEGRLMRAYVNGWTVEKPKRWNVKVPHVDAQEGLWFFVNSDGKVDATYDQDLAAQFTAAEIDQYGLQDCEKVEVTDDAD